MGNDVRDLKVVPTAPLEHYISVAIQLLNDQADDPRVVSAPDHDLTQVHDLGVVAHHEDMAVRKDDQVVSVGRIAVPALEAVHDLVASVERVVAPGGGVEIGQPTVRLQLEI